MNKKDFILELFAGGQIGIYPQGVSWKNKEHYHFRFDAGRTIVEHARLLEACGEQMKGVMDTIAPDASHLCGIPRAGLPLAKEMSRRYGLGLIAYDRSWHALYDFADYLKSRKKYVRAELKKFMPHGSYGGLEGGIDKGAKIFLVDNVASANCASKLEAKEILEKLLHSKGLALRKDVEITGVGVLQNNSPYAHEILEERFGAVLTAPETFGTLRQEGLLDDKSYGLVLGDLYRLGWFSSYATKERVGDDAVYRTVRNDFRRLRR